MISVIIAAHDEEHGIGACLDSVFAQADAGAIQVIVSANGCSDDTAGVARRRGATVVERAEAGKAGALNHADSVAVGFPRVYLDADILVPPHGIARLVEGLGDGVLAAAPRRTLDTRGSALPVRAYCAINERLPVFQGALFGRGMVAVSAAGRARFDLFPDAIADDLFLDGQFAARERREVREVVVRVRAPRTTGALLQRLVRVRRGNAQLRADAARGKVGARVRESDRWAWFRDVVVPRPWLAPAAIPYVGITVAAELIARRSSTSWGRDETSRRRGGSPGAHAAP